MPENEELDELCRKAEAAAAAAPYPISTYRLQLNREFKFKDAAAVAPYLHELGVTHLYLSPVMKSRPGSEHGYDVTDHNRLNPELGSEEDFYSLAGELERLGMGIIIDFVPNHMGTTGNEWWHDVLANGQASRYASFFDIDWQPSQPWLRGKVLLPVLEDGYSTALGSGKLRLGFSKGSFLLLYGTLSLPVEIKSSALVLKPCLERLSRRLGEEHPDALELDSIISAAAGLPESSASDKEPGEKRRREGEVIRRRLEELYRTSAELRCALDDTLDLFNCGADGYNQLHALLEAQAYRLASWRTAAEELNYRRFFEITDLVGLRVEDEEVFEQSHRLLRRLLQEGCIDGVRIDHLDGLYDPAGYLLRLQQARLLDLCLGIAEREQAPVGIDAIRRKISKMDEAAPSRGRKPLYVVVEKILGEGERLRRGWAAEGTTGYEFGAALNGIFVDSGKSASLLEIYRRFTGMAEDFSGITYQCKKRIMDSTMQAEADSLARCLERVAKSSRRCLDLTFSRLRRALTGLIACLPVYRTYIDAPAGFIQEEDREVISVAVSEARRRNPGLDDALDFLAETLLLQPQPDMDGAGRRRRQSFVMRFQQSTGAIMAKGVEDTAFYVYAPLASLNEVGGSPGRMGISLEEFHRQNRKRREDFPRSLISTYTHDSKRSEDVRMRINVLSEMPEEWQSVLERWSALNRDKKTALQGHTAPDPAEEYFIYQTMLGTYPDEDIPFEQREDYHRRLASYMTKALREAKRHTSWVEPDPAYEKAVLDFLSAILDPSLSGEFLHDFLTLNRAVAACGRYGSLSQAVIKLFSPGVPDVYRGSELWDLSLVDPDNRRPVDFARRGAVLAQLRREVAEDRAALARRLAQSMPTGDIKLYATWQCLSFRWENARLFETGKYLPLEASGQRQANLCAFVWLDSSQQLIVAAPRLIASLTSGGKTAPCGSVWGETRLLMPGFRPGTFRNIFTGEKIAAGTSIPLADIFASFPAAALTAV